MTSNQPDAFCQSRVRELGKTLLGKDKSVNLRLGGYSMFPSLLPGDLARVQNVESSVLKLGDVVIIEQGSSWIAHRIVSIKTGPVLMVQTQGDSLVSRDRTVSEEKILGVVTAVERNGRTIKLQDTGKLFVRLSPFPQILSRLVLIIQRKANRLTSASTTP